MQSPALIASQLKSSLSNRGFTLIELLLVIAIMGILAAMVMPGLNGIYHRQVLDNAAQEMVVSIKSAQNNALSNNQKKYTGPEDELQNDCTATKPYVEYYRFVVINTKSYQAQRYFKVRNSVTNELCSRPTGAADVGIQSEPIQLPGTVELASNNPSLSVEYTSVTGALKAKSTSGPTDTTKTYFTMTSSQVDNLTYYICVTQGRVYAQNTVCW